MLRMEQQGPAMPLPVRKGALLPDLFRHAPSAFVQERKRSFAARHGWGGEEGQVKPREPKGALPLG